LITTKVGDRKARLVASAVEDRSPRCIDAAKWASEAVLIIDVVATLGPDQRGLLGYLSLLLKRRIATLIALEYIRFGGA
jgi:hypothetical protein